MSAPTYEHETERLAALYTYGILDTPPEEGFEHITSMVARLFNVPVAAVTLVDADRQWFKSIRGLNLCETPRTVSFCAHAMLGTEVLVISDAQLDERFADNLLVTGPPGIRFYAGAPLRTPEGHPLGALCVIGYQPREFSSTDRRMLSEMASLVEDELLLRRAANELRSAPIQVEKSGKTPVRERQTGRRLRPEPREKSEPGAGILPPPEKQFENTGQNGDPSEGDRFRHIVEQANDAIFVYDLSGKFLDVNEAGCKMFGYGHEQLMAMRLSDLEIGFDPVKAQKRWREMAVGEATTMEGLNRRADGSVFWAEVKVSVVETGAGRQMLALVRDITRRKEAEATLQIRARQQREVSELGVIALRGERIDDLLDRSVASIGTTLGIRICRVLEHQPERGVFVVRAGLDLSREERGEVAAHDGPEFPAGHVLRTGEPAIIDWTAGHQRFQMTPWLKAAGAVSGVHVRVGGDGSCAPKFGVLVAYFSERRIFTEDDVYFLQSVANVLATAIARQRTEDALRVAETSYRRIAANTPGVVYQYQTRPDGTLAIPFISESCRTLFGVGPEEMQAAPEIIENSVHPEDRSGFDEAVAEAEEKLIPLLWRGRLVLAGGEVRWVRFQSKPEPQPDGSVICDGIIVDVTEEEEREEALRQSEERFRLANYYAPFPALLHTDDGEILQVNAAWTRLTGYRPDQLTTIENWLRLAYPNDDEQEQIRKYIEGTWREVNLQEKPDCRIRCADGSDRVWSFIGAHLGKLSDGRRLRIVTAADVTERNNQEAALRASKEEAERANAAKSQFLSRMSHELRTPLNAILGFGQVLEFNGLKGQDAVALSYILKGGRHLLGLIDEVLDLSRAENGELLLTPRRVHISQLMNECVALVARLAEARRIVCSVQGDATGPTTLWCDEQRMRQMLLNLLSNAIKYNRDGGTITVASERIAPDRLRLKVSDTGPGIPPEKLKRLFVPFERLGQENNGIEGTGLGLVVSRQIAEAMDGSIGVTSEIGRGSTFWIELPLGPVSADVDPVSEPTQKVGNGKNGVTLLYIEDNQSNLQVAQMLIERCRPQWRFQSATDGKSGLELARQTQPSLILLDFQLPDMLGDEVLAELRQHPATSQIPVVVLTADATALTKKRLLASGADKYISKPFDYQDLLQSLDMLLEMGAGGQGTPNEAATSFSIS